MLHPAVTCCDLDPSQVIPVFMTFSARTSANQTMDIIDAKMDKRRKVCSCILLNVVFFI